MPRTAHLNEQRRKAYLITFIQRGLTMASIARDLGVSRTTMHHVVAGRRTSARIEQHLEKLCPEVAKKFPFRRHGSKVARSSQQVNCPQVQEGRSPSRRRSPPRKSKRSSARGAA